MKIVAMIPTYNERENIIPLLKEIIALSLIVDVLVVDDDSPDGTWRAVQDFAASRESDGRVHLLRRTEKRGRGYAGAEGFAYAVNNLGADIVVEMDGDGSHSPSYIPLMIDAITSAEGADVVIGSRYVTGGKDVHRSLVRKMVSAFARRYLAFVLGLKVCDPTSGFRAFNKKALKCLIGKLKSSDPFIVTEVLLLAVKNSLKVKEIPIEFKERAAGSSKLKPATLLKYLVKVWKIKFENI